MSEEKNTGNANKAIEHWYLHVDLDAFFASVEQLDNPQYRGKPVIVGGLPNEKRSVVSTASYEARTFGVHSAMPVSQAYRLCPQGIFLHGRMKRYAELSYQIMSIFKNYSPDVYQMSIDEAFIDLTGTEKLFGDPAETARRLKAEVKTKTGLTVSIGLAPTKYLAKIASGLSKPDGFYQIKKGEEENFMLNLPLEKVWGLGPKSVELIRKKGIFTTREIQNLPYENLEFMFGKNMASFLYEAVHGIEKDSFQKERKNHSISAETTFTEDLIDSYSAETQLLQLAEGVMFRLLKEKASSKTVFIKIRYNDFSTISCQETQESPVSTIESFFEIAKKLFNQKYSEGRGIRLLGIGFDNVSKDCGPVQQSLFEDPKKEKKEKLEQAILKMKLKNPEIKIHKARTLKIITLFIFSSLLFSKTRLFSEDTVINKGAAGTLPESLALPQTENYEKEKEALFELDINDKEHVEFTFSGFYQGEISGGSSLSWTKELPLVLSGNLPVFKQEVQLSTSVMLNKRWYFQGDFADSFKTNTLTMGYKGEGFVKAVKLSNRSITMPSIYSADFFGFSVSGGNNEAPGISANFQSSDKKHKLDALLRYDVTRAKSAVFYGKNSVNDTKIPIKNFAYGKAFVFPHQDLSYLADIKDIYIENKNGTYTDKKGKIYKKASKTDYRTLLEKDTLLFSSNAGTGVKNEQIPCILITFQTEQSFENILKESSSYDDKNSFTGKIQEIFNKANQKYSLKDYTYPLEDEIQGEKALLIQNSYGFSPFMKYDLYDCSLIKEADLSIISLSTEETLTSFYAAEYSENAVTDYEDFFEEKKYFAQIIYEEDSLLSYPFAQIAPQIYLNLNSLSDLALLVRSYTPVSDFYIGTRASGGSVQVYKNGILESSRYDQTSGTVEIFSSVSQSDKIVIYWQEEDSDFSNGAIAAALGYNVQLTPHLFADLALTSRIPVVAASTMASLDSLQTAFTALSAGIQYENNNLTLLQKTAFSLQKENSSDSLLVYAPNQTEAKTSYLSASDGFEIQAIPEILEEEASFDGTIKNFTGKSDKEISGYKIPLSWDFSAFENKSSWAAVDIKLSSGQLLKNSSSFEIALEAELEQGADNYDKYELYIQLGVNAGNKKEGEDENLPFWKIEDFDFTSKKWQTIRISLTDKDRARLISHHDARIIVKRKWEENNTDSSTEKHKGCIYIGPYQTVTQGIYTFYDDKLLVNSSISNLAQKSSSSKPTDYYSRISWKTLEEDLDDKEAVITAVSYFTQADFSMYKKIDFSFALIAKRDALTKEKEEDSPTALTFILDQGAASAKEEGKDAIRLSIYDYESLISEELQTHTLTIDITGGATFLDGQEISKELYTLFIDKNVKPDRQKIELGLYGKDKIYRSGDFYSGAIVYKENDLYWKALNYSSAEYKKDNIITINDKKIVKDGGIKLSSLQSFSNNFTISSDASGGITIFGTRLEAQACVNQKDFSKASHKLESVDSLFNIINIKENFIYNKDDYSSRKEDSLKLDFTPYFPLILQTSASSNQNEYNQKQKADGKIASDIKLGKGEISFLTEVFNEEKIINSRQNNSFSLDSNYFEAWLSAAELQFSKGSDAASYRKSGANAKLSGKLPLGKIAFSPECQYSLKALYNSSSQSQFTDTTLLKFTLPFSIGIHKISISTEKSAEGNSFNYPLEEPSSYLEDCELFYQLHGERSWFYSSLPIYDLFDKELPSTITADYKTKYQAEYSRKLFNSLQDIWVPSSLKLTLSRNINAEQNSSDLYQIKTVVSNMSINNFGSQGRLKLFPWFKQDELYSSLTGILKLPQDLKENTSWLLSFYLQALLYISQKAFITSAVDLSLENSGDWLTRMTLIYTRPGKDCLIFETARLFAPRLEKSKVNIIRKNSLNVEIGSKDSFFHQKYELTHYAEMNFLKYFSITSSLGLAYSSTNQNTAVINLLNLTASLGVKAEF